MVSERRLRQRGAAAAPDPLPGHPTAQAPRRAYPTPPPVLILPTPTPPTTRHVLNPTPTTPEHHPSSRTVDSSNDTMEVGTMYQLGSAQTAPLLAATGAMATGYYAVGAWTLLVAGLAALTTGRVLARRRAGRA